ncbi:MAG: pilus assembly protein [Planctomycetaceae bacterium]|nr:pilus assembly protein [Planctomycetaceae bacterium]MBT6486657.1 pilus assembly protein [Planctomycetaceae bacterium]MBT6495950.1 pilus assembly protein [Planctomycetaceae bacterium]
MHRAILIQCLPALIALAISFAVLVLLVKFSGAKLNWRRLGELHRCQDGGVQSLSFVLTLPLFLMFVMFIVQVSQLMIGMVTVNYAAFAAARSASVWIPAEVTSNGYGFEPQNQFNTNLFAAPFGAAYQSPRIIPEQGTMTEQVTASSISHKYSRIRTAAVMGCAPIAPSRDVNFTTQEMTLASATALEATKSIYRSMVPESVANQRTNRRLENKIQYADRNTLVLVEWSDSLSGPNSLNGPTYNPVNHPSQGFSDDEEFVYKPYEIGWQDPVSVYVVHRYALFPGPGRLLASLLVRPVGVPARIRQMIPAEWQTSYVAESDIYSVLIPAAATLPAEGIKSRRPYVHYPN